MFTHLIEDHSLPPPMTSRYVQWKGRRILNNDLSAISAWRLKHVVPYTLPILLRAWDLVEDATGYAWRSTSFIRQSFSHKLGHSMDLAPDMTPSLAAVYSGNNGSDPILHSRVKLLKALLRIKDVRIDPTSDLIIAVESDHLHMQVIARGSLGPHPINILRWQALKPVYQDTYPRNLLADLRREKQMN